MSSLYIVATPIGNLQDITYRAVETLREVDIIACEDTRRTRKLLTHFAIHKPCISCRAHNERETAQKIVRLLEEGNNIAYASDAGTPGVSDPGSMLASTVRDAGYRVIPIPGASALTTLLSVVGEKGKTITFEGFLPVKSGKRKKRLEELINREEGFILFESPYRIIKVLQEIADCNYRCYVYIGREMTKLHEEFIHGTVIEVLKDFENNVKQKGEFSIYVSGKKKN